MTRNSAPRGLGEAGMHVAHACGMRLVLCTTLQADLSGDMTTGPKKAFGADCTADIECESNQCRTFQMQTISKCTKSCTVATEAADCPNPPSTGTCNASLVCKF